jgi:hypothetical protein
MQDAGCKSNLYPAQERKKKSVPYVVRIPEGQWGKKRIPHKNRRVIWKDGERNENRRRCKE